MVDSKIYYSDFYWNDLKIVKDHINRLISGRSEIDYINNFANKSNRKFKKALVLNCGNGHVEREFISRNIVESAIGIDISKDLIAQAETNKGDMKIDYIQCDINEFDFTSLNFDLLIVYAAGHHIKCLHKVFASTSKKLAENNGMIVGFDYIGAHRNQYEYDVWEKLNYYNLKLPKNFQNNLIYPHLPTMLVTDPSEAIHSELLEGVLKFYFDLDFTMLGGGVAYEIISHNENIREMVTKNKNIDLLNKFVSSILEWDIKESREDNRFNLFASFYGYPKNDLNSEDVENKIKEEFIYEKAFPLGSEYYPKNLIQILTEELSDKSIGIIHKQNYIDECHKKIDLLNKSISENNFENFKNIIKERFIQKLKKSLLGRIIKKFVKIIS